jgi:uncharacterized protein YbjT (DUF2867 family)
VRAGWARATVRVFVAGATGVLGVRVAPLLVEAGHEVVGLTRTAEKAAALRDIGVAPVVGDVYDAGAIERAVAVAKPDALLNLLTDLPDDPAQLGERMPANNRIRREGSRNLLRAARRAGVERVVAESVAWPLEGDAGAAVDELERETIAAGGVVVRYGQLYGPGTYWTAELPSPPRVHVDGAARRTPAALAATPGSVLEVVEV